MHVHFGLANLKSEWPRAVVCIGTFDGVHLGHRAVLRRAIETAREQEVPCVLVTFDRHPAAILAPDQCPKTIAPLEENLAQIAMEGVGAAVVLPFDRELSGMSAERFLREIVLGACRGESVVVGHDFAMGHDRVGTTDWIASRVPTVVVPPFEIDGRRVSSSQIRTSIEVGDVAGAAQLLGRPFAISGLVVGGQRLGRQLGYPTANLARSIAQVTPADGVYAATFDTHRGTYVAAVAIGTRPAVGGGDRTIEAYLLDYPGDSLYGQACRTHLHHRLRPEENFPSLDALKLQMKEDVEKTRELMAASRYVPSSAS